MSKLVRTTVADAIVRFMIAQHIHDDRTGREIPYFAGVMAIFGHGNALSLGESLHNHRDQIRTLRGQNETAMGLAAVGYAKAARRRQAMAVTTSIGPGALNTTTAAGVAMANRLPLLLLLGDTFQSRDPDPVLQQIEHFDAPGTTANDALRPLSRFFDRITSPSQLIPSLRQMMGVLLDPADCGPVTLALPQDVQAMAFDFPESLFALVVHQISRPRPPSDQLARAAHALRNAQRPLIVAGGGVHYSLAEDSLKEFAHRHRVPVMETVAGKSSLLASDPAYAGPIGVFGEAEGHDIAWHPDVVVAVGTRLQDFTTESGTVFKDPDTTIIGINAARFDALKRRALPVVGDARESLDELSELLGEFVAPEQWWKSAQASRRRQATEVAARIAPTTETIPTYAQVIGVVHDVAAPDDYIVTASGGLPGELVMNWSAKSVASFDCEYGFSCMGYEFSGTWGAALEREGSGTTVYGMGGDGSFLMFPMDVYSAVLHRTPVTYIVCDNGGFNVIERLQLGHGAASFRTMLTEDDHPAPALVDFTAMAEALGARAHKVNSLTELRDTLSTIKASSDVHVVVTSVAAHQWSEGGSFWEVGVPEVTSRQSVREAHQQLQTGKALQQSVRT